jgi:Transglutaminase-like superfamily
MLRPLLVLLLFVGATRADTPAKPAPGTLKAFLAEIQHRQAYGIYVSDGKVGWMIAEVKLGKLDGQDVALASEEVYIDLKREGQPLTMEITTTVYFSLEGNGAVLLIEEKSKENARTTERKGIRKGDRLAITTTINGRADTERVVALPKKTLALSKKQYEWLKAPRKKGDTFESFSIKLDNKNIDTPEVITFLSKKNVAWGGVPTDVYEISTLSQNLRQHEECKADGTTIRGKIGGILEVKAELEATAKKLDAKGVDIMRISSIDVDKQLGFPNAISSLTLEAIDLGDFKLPQSHRQKVRKGDKGEVIIETRRDFKVEKEAPLSKEERAEMTEATPTVQADHPRVKELAKKVVGDEKDLHKAAGLIKDWVHKNMKQTLSANATTTLEVLDTRAGDCTEHSLLFVSLARAAGLPAREVGGLAYVPLPRPTFGWHAWAEFHDGRQWVTVDPTWDQLLVDATHITFSTSSDDWSWLEVLGKLKFKVIESEKKK